MAEKRLKAHNRFRRAVQAIAGLAQNSFFSGYLTGKIYRGPLKRFCLPGMNCYSCPGAVGACPIGALQAAVGRKSRFSFYVLGYLALIGVLFGRFVCGWLCLFGLIQELLYKIPVKKLKVPEMLDRRLRYLKYAVLLIAVFLLTGFVRVENGLVSVPWFCKYICPVGMLEGGIPLVAMNAELQRSIGRRYLWKGFLLLVTLLSSVFIYRPFCRYVCPLGAFYGLFQRFSFLRLTPEREKCVGCGECARRCPMHVDVLRDPNSPECIRCGECVQACPASALSFTLLDKRKPAPAQAEKKSPERAARRRRRAVLLAVLLAAGALAVLANTSPAAEPEHAALVFTAEDMDRNTVDSRELFGRSDVTMLNVWASYCAPCARELPELSALQAELMPEGAQIVTLLWDSDAADTEEARLAADILETGGVDLICLLHNGELEAQLGGDIVGMPTSFLIDREGRILSGPRAGADGGEQYREWIREYLEKNR